MEEPICGNIDYEGRILHVAANDSNGTLETIHIKDAETGEPVEITDDLMRVLNQAHQELLELMRVNTDEYIEDRAEGIDSEGVGF